MKTYDGYKLWRSLTKSKKTKSMAIDNFFKDKIYCLKRLGNNKYQMLNRHYVPIGMSEEQYASFNFTGPIEVVERDGIENYFEGDFLKFYSSINYPWESNRNWQSYCEKLDKFGLLGYGY